jgi:hypothetical protein
MHVERFSVLPTLFVLGMLPLAAQTSPDATLTIAITGTLGPVLAGSDPLGTAGHTGSVTFMVSESSTPTTVTGNSVIYTIPAGAITDVLGQRSFTTTTPGKMSVHLSSAADVLSIVYNSRDNTVTVVTAYLAAGSWNSFILMHPVPFSPSPQTLTSATVAGGPGTQLRYTTNNGAVTVVGMAGTASNSAPTNPVVPDPEQPVQ